MTEKEQELRCVIDGLMLETGELRALLSSIHADLLMRAAVDENGKKVANLSHSVWVRLKGVLE